MYIADIYGSFVGVEDIYKLHASKKRKMFRSIKLEDKKFSVYKSKSIDDLSKVNLFVGQNNSGKSRFIRKLFSTQNLHFTSKNLDLDELNRITNKFYGDLNDFFTSRGIDSFGKVVSNISSYQPINYITKDFTPEKDIYKKVLSITNAGTGGSIALNKGNYRDEIGEKLSEGYDYVWPKLQAILPHEFSYKYDSIYIPPLRGLRPLIKNDKQDFYKQRTLDDHFKDNKGELENKIYTGLTLYEEVKKLLLGRHSERKKVSDFENFLQNVFFNNKNVHLIPNINDDVLYIKIGEQSDIPIYELGDGIQSIIIITFPLFFHRDENLKVYIDEPELYLHPGMQRILLNALTNSKLFPKHQFFMSTHSNHLLDMTSDFNQISIYTFSQDSEDLKFNIINIENGNSDVLNILGVNNSSVFLSNCTIWIEGITDRLYIRKYLQVYLESISDENIKEDLHYSFVEYGGGNITHWSFLDDADPEYPNINVKYLCGKLFLISDKDGAGLKNDGTVDSRKQKKYKRHQKLLNKLNDRYYCLQSREIENTLSPKVLKTTIKKFEKGNTENLEFNNWTFDKYKNKKIGDFINSNVIGKSRNYATDTGTINEKLKFSKRAVISIKTIDDLSSEAKDLTEKLYNFIIAQNIASM